MQATDMRSLSRDARHERRVQVIGLRRSGRSYDDIACQTGLSRTGVFDICKRWKLHGGKGLYDAPGGRPAGEGRALDLVQEVTMREVVATKTPDEMQLPWALWTRAAVGQLIEQYCAVALSVRAVGLYLARWGFTPQKPLTQAREQSPAAVKQWLRKDYPQIAARAHAEGAEIHWGDETGLRIDDVRGRGYAPRGQTPVVRVTRKRQNLSVISTVTNKGQMRWRVLDGAMNGARLIDFMQRLVRDVKKKVFLILDNLPAHHTKLVKAWLTANVERIEVFYLPSYSPQLNPDEMANADLKQAVTKRVPARTKEELAKAVKSHLRSVQRQPERIRKYFQHDPVRYAA
jgi:transposase